MKRLHLLSNAHLDPVWQWRWQEGVGASITTFSAAADFCEEFDGYIFCHNEAILYQWIEENDPSLFGRIQRLVAEGKWHIMGGWYLQPDCNMINGESFIRQMQRGLEYFKEKFPGFERPDVAINFDSFGHTKGLVQILCDAGYKGYVCMRPCEPVESCNAVWKGYADSQVFVYRVYNAYNTLLGQVDQRLEPFLLNFGNMEEGLCLWGGGNHGGGPSRQDYRIIEELKKKYPDTEFIHSTPDKYFKEIEKKLSSFAEVKELNYVNMGCYTSMIRIKQLHQRLENELERAEKMAAHAELSGVCFDREGLKRAQDDLLFCQFHDILPGSCIKSAEDDAIMQLSHGIAEAEKIQMRAFFALAGAQPKAAPGEYPVLVYHPHPFAAKRDIECEFMLADQNWSQEEFYDVKIYVNGKEIPCQLEKESSNVPLDWRKRIVFTLEMQPFSMNRVCVFTERKKRPEKKNFEIKDKFVFDNGRLRAVIDGSDGLISSLSADGKEYLHDSGRLNVVQNCCDPWGFNYDDYRERLGSFRLLDETESAKFAAVARKTLCPVRVIEDGKVRTVVEALFGFGSSRAAVKYILPKSGTELRVHIDVFNDEKDIKLKFELNTSLKNTTLKGRTAFGMNELPQNGGEVTAQDYIIMSDGENAVSAIHFGTYGLSATDGRAEITLLNSAAYCAHPVDDRVIMPDDRFGARIDQGERSYDFEFNFSSAKERELCAEAESRLAHQPPYALSFFPTGNGKACAEFGSVSNPAVTLSAIRSSYDGKNKIVRLYNSLETPAETEIFLPFAGIKEKVGLKGYQFKTFILGKGKLVPCNCLEEE